MSFTKPIRSEQEYVISYRTLRKSVGFLGIALPVVLIIAFSLMDGKCQTPPSISHYYYTVLGSYFTGTLCAVALFLFAYNGPAKADRIAATVAAISALGVAFCPTNSFMEYDGNCMMVGLSPNDVRNALHFIFAALLFLTFAYFCFFLFTKTNPGGKMTKKKKQRNVVYAVAGTLILLSVGMTCCLSLIPMKGGGFRLGIFTSEAVGLFSFGVSWLIKGEFVLKDDGFEIDK